MTVVTVLVTPSSFIDIEVKTATIGGADRSNYYQTSPSSDSQFQGAFIDVD